jgi:CCR4-NOT transcription complex subunit 1
MVPVPQTFDSFLQPAGVAPEMLESILTIIVGDNIDLGCSVIERAATEKATRDVDKLLQPSYDERTLARVHGKPFVDSSSSHGRFPQSLPDSLRPRPGQMSAQLLRVYEDFSRIPKTLSASSGPGTHPGGIEGMFMDRFSQWQSRADSIIARDADGASQPSDQSALQHLLQELSANVNEVGPANAEELAVLFARRVVKHLSEQGTKLHMTFYVASLEALALACTGSSSAGGKRLSDELSKIVLEEENKVSKEVIEMLIRARLLSLPELDASVLKLLSSPLGSKVQQASELLMHLIKSCMLNRDGQGQATLMMQDLPKSMELLTSLASRNPLGNDAIIQSVDQARKASLLAGVANRSPSEVPAPVRDKATDPPGLREQAISQFDEWLRLLSTSSEEKTLSSFLVNLKNAGLLDLDDTTDRFFRLLIELCINHSLSGLEVNGRSDFSAQLLCVTIDGLVKLVLSIVHIGGEAMLAIEYICHLTYCLPLDSR